MKIDDLLGLAPGLRKHASLPEMDPLTEEDALQEAQILDVRFDVTAGIAGILFELRQALQLQEASTGVLVAHGVRELNWTGPGRDEALTAWSVGSSMPQATGGLFSLDLVIWPHPGARMSLTAETAAFFVGEVPSLAVAPPDYTDRDREAIVGEVANWGSTFEPVSAVFLDKS
jgi:hypothetical protein